MLQKIRPVVQLAKTFSDPLPGLDVVGQQIKGLIGGNPDTGIPIVDDLIKALEDPSLINLLNTGSTILSGDEADAVKGVVEAINSVSDVLLLVDRLDALSAVTVDFGDFSIGGGTTNLRAFGGSLDSVPLNSTTPKEAASDPGASTSSSAPRRLLEQPPLLRPAGLEQDLPAPARERSCQVPRISRLNQCTEDRRGRQSHPVEIRPREGELRGGDRPRELPITSTSKTSGST